MTAIQQNILNKLAETEDTYQVKIPLAIESGSRGWGFASPDSDYDCRFIYVHQRDWYLSVTEKKSFIEYDVDNVYDINGWDLKKALQHLMKSNAVIFEWLSSEEIYIDNKEITGLLKEAAAAYFNPLAVSHHYLSLAKKKYHEILEDDMAKLKKYFYILRPLANLAFIYQYNKMPYMAYEKNLAAIEVPKDIKPRIQELLAIKADVDESYRMPVDTALMDYFRHAIEFNDNRLREMKYQKPAGYDSIDTVFRTVLEMVWRYD